MKIDSTLIASTVTELRGQPLKTGQTLAAIVLQANQATGKAVLSLAGGQVTVSTQQPLTTGSAIQLTVRDVGPPVVLGLTPSPAESMAARTSSQTPVQTLISLLMTKLSSGAMVSSPKADFTPVQGQQTNTATNPSPSSTTTTPSTSPADSTAGKTPVGTAPIATTTQSIKLDLPLNVRMALPNLDPVLNAARTGQLSGSANPMPSGKPAEHALAQNLTQLITSNSLPTSITNASGDQSASDIKSQLKLAAQQLKLQAALESPATGKESAAASRGAQSPSPAQSTAQSTTQATSQVSAQVNAQARTQVSTQANVQASTSTALQSTPQAAQQAAPQNSSIQSSLEQWISRLDVSQLRTAIQQIQGQPTWVVDVPMMVAEQPRRFQIAIQEQHQNANQPAESTWQLDFAIELPELGPLHGSLSLQTTDLTVRMYADKPEARDQLNASLDQLAEHLRAASLTPKELSIYPGPPPKAVQERLNPEPSFDGNTTFRCQV